MMPRRLRRRYLKLVAMVNLGFAALAFGDAAIGMRYQNLDSASLLLSTRCISCHNPEKRAGGVDLSTRGAALLSKAVVPGAPERSRLVAMVTSGKMPPTGKLPEPDVTLFSAWIKSGAPY